MIKAVIFDCFGVLTADSWKQFVEAQPESVDVDRLAELNRQLDAGFLTRSDFTEQIKDLTGTQPNQIEDILSSSEAVKNTKLFDVIKDLKNSNYMIGMISNVSSNWIREVFLNQEEQALFNDMVFSYEVSLTKPNPEIFILTAERLQVKPSECLFIDDAEINCLGATQTGMASIVYVNTNQCINEIKALLSLHKDNN